MKDTVYKGTLLISPAETNSTTENTDPQNSLPKIYADYADIFSKIEARELLPHHTFDHPIELEPGAKPPWGPIYGMSKLELCTPCKYLDDNAGQRVYLLIFISHRCTHPIR
jgi:hypothetical protein